MTNIEKVYDTIQAVIDTINTPIRSSFHLCGRNDDTDVRSTIHALLRVFACFNNSGQRCVPCYPGKGAQECRHGEDCPYLLSQCIFQWCARRCGSLNDMEIRKNLSGCNFYHSPAEISGLRGDVFDFMEGTYGDSDYADKALSKVNGFFQYTMTTDYKTKKIPVCWELPDGKTAMGWLSIYLSDDNIFYDTIIDSEDEDEVIDDKSDEEVVKNDEEAKK